MNYLRRLIKPRNFSSLQQQQLQQQQKHQNHQKQQHHETKADETRRDPELDHSPLGETHRGDQEPQKPVEPLSRTDGNQPPQPGDEPRGKSSGVISEEEFQEALRKAFNDGVIAGRNQKIEETLYSQKTDGIPVFHGMPAKANASSDIFSLAREA